MENQILEQIEKPKKWSAEYRKDYNEKYYKANKVKIINKLCTKVKCDKCNKEITKTRYNSHKMSKLCKKREQELTDAKVFLQDILKNQNKETENVQKLLQIKNTLNL